MKEFQISQDYSLKNIQLKESEEYMGKSHLKAPPKWQQILQNIVFLFFFFFFYLTGFHAFKQDV